MPAEIKKRFLPCVFACMHMHTCRYFFTRPAALGKAMIYMAYMVHDTYNLHGSVELHVFLLRLSANSCAVSCRFSTQIRTDSYGSGGMQYWTVCSAKSTQAHVKVDPRRVVCNHCICLLESTDRSLTFFLYIRIFHLCSEWILEYSLTSSRAWDYEGSEGIQGAGYICKVSHS